MRKTILLAIFALASFTSFAQIGPGFGIKAGLNYSANGDYFNSAENAYEDPSRNMGYHIGIFGKIGNRLYVRPELVYTKTKSDYDGDKFDMSKLDLPVLVGAKVIGPLHIFAGPAFQYILDTEFEGITTEDVENDFTVGFNFGAGVNLGKFGIDLRYERGFNSNEVNFISTNITDLQPNRVDTRPDQIIVSLSLNL
ncbi:outer membrane beta-barrel protein [Maribacter luteus]|uniref:outer membrane beta-barrel protein n=1 Tax=Maribacter luteus TaxID=2594478 RepID=UPI00249304FD|nr:outer membrane beta-barrel protein [Maribacter luteus]